MKKHIFWKQYYPHETVNRDESTIYSDITEANSRLVVKRFYLDLQNEHACAYRVIPVKLKWFINSE